MASSSAPITKVAMSNTKTRSQRYFGSMAISLEASEARGSTLESRGAWSMLFDMHKMRTGGWRNDSSKLVTVEWLMKGVHIVDACESAQVYSVFVETF